MADDPPAQETVRSAAEIALEAALKIETERREAAETKLGSVQVKFEEAKANLLDALKLVLECQRELAEKDRSPNAVREMFEFAEV
mgnify:CR=1 FL=1